MFLCLFVHVRHCSKLTKRANGYLGSGSKFDVKERLVVPGDVVPRHAFVFHLGKNLLEPRDAVLIPLALD